MKKLKRHLELGAIVSDQIMKLFDEENEDYIDLNELIEKGEETDFMHAVANLAPTLIYNRLTQNNLNTLEFNHVANTLCFQYSQKDNQ